ncbi:hypothetical protein GCM10009754_49900 [Amycolatopsis minnesotensis]|uniref:Lyzozyme M1 (1,4-beta-N-acetylmuramidase), GH25 family n=1 Tax=Amycolatopsis minnesotensis TaxID=337894 RepID=A0ABP5CZU7_9PSEU
MGYVWTKVTDGGGIATAGPADAIVNGAHSVGIPVGGYHYAQLSPTPERQAEIFVAEVRRLNATGLVPALDLEAPFGPNAGARDFGIRLCRRVADLGFRPGVYLNNAFAKTTRPDQWGIPGLTIWIARYGARPDPAAGHYDVHQYSSSGHIPGIQASAVDLNESYTNNHFATASEDTMPTVDELLNAPIGKRPNGTNISLKDAVANTYLAGFYGGGDAGPKPVFATVNAIYAQNAAQDTVIAQLTKAVADQGHIDLDALRQAVQDAIKNAVVQVDVNVNGHGTTTPEVA